MTRTEIADEKRRALDSFAAAWLAAERDVELPRVLDKLWFEYGRRLGFLGFRQAIERARWGRTYP